MLEQLHFHWGSDDTMGSEHTVNRKRFPLEMHLVHRNLKYASIGEALDKSDGLSVVGVFFEIDHSEGTKKAWMQGVKHEPSMCDEFAGAMANVRQPGQTFNFHFNVSQHANLDFHNYFLYSGSLTTPNCNEGLKWIVSASFSGVTCDQMKAFRGLLTKSGHAMQDNFRPTQPLNARKVYKIENGDGGGQHESGTLAANARLVMSRLSPAALASLSAAQADVVHPVVLPDHPTAPLAHFAADQQGHDADMYYPAPPQGHQAHVLPDPRQAVYGRGDGEI